LLRDLASVESLSVSYYDELLEYFVKIDERSQHKVIPFVLGITSDDVFYIYSIYPLLLSFNGGVIDQDGEIVFNSQANIDALTWLKKFITVGKVNLLIDFREARRLFTNGQVAFLMDGPWARSIFPTLNSACSDQTEEIGFSPLLKTPVGLSYSVLGNHVLSILQQCEDKEAAIDFLRFLALDPEVAAIYYRQTGLLPALSDDVENNPLYSDEFGRVQREQLKLAKAIPDSQPAFSLSVGFCAKACREILIGDADIKSTLDSTSAIIKELYRSVSKRR
jgi:ABC-type glycerol-3-phosphate transport system substrate-binding protein